jgi:hypothetical protein
MKACLSEQSSPVPRLRQLLARTASIEEIKKIFGFSVVHFLLLLFLEMVRSLFGFSTV